MGKDEETDIAVECSVLDIGFSFDVGRSMFDVRRSSFKTIPYGINVTCERLQNNLALMGVVGGLGIFQLKIPVHIISPGLGNRPDANGDHKEGHPVGLYRFF